VNIEIRLDDLFVKESEKGMTAKEALRRAVIDEVYSELWPTVAEQAKEQVASAIYEETPGIVTKELTKIFSDVIDHEFQEVATWGQPRGTWSVRKRILDAVEKSCVFKNEYHRQDNNAFTKAVLSTVESCMTDFKKEFTDKIKKELCDEAMKYAVTELSKRLGVK
jgi:hypothetical protein